MRILPEEKVKALIELMNADSQGKIPPEPPILDCFDMSMNEKTLDYLLALGPGKHTMEQLEAQYNAMYADGAWQETWQSIFEHSFLVPTPDSSGYLLATIFPGWIEMSVSGPLTDYRRDLLNKFMEFWGMLYDLNVPHIRHMSDMAHMKDIQTAPAHMTSFVSHGKKEISLNQALSSEQQVYATGEVYQVLARHKDEIAVMHCFCRQHKQMNGGDPCANGIPVEACMTVGPISTQLVNNGTARRLSFEEACDLLDDLEAHGCVHTAFHYGNNVEHEEVAICNCCPDCCELYGGWQRGYLSQILVKAYYSPEMIDESRCVGCNQCGRYCPTTATYYDKEAGKLMFDYDKCVGCGQCVNQCKFDVRKMVRDERSVFVKTKEERPPR